MILRTTLLLVLLVGAQYAIATEPGTAEAAKPRTHVPRDGFRVYEDPGCGFSLELPSSWLAEASSSETFALGYRGPRQQAACAAGIQPSDWRFIRSTSNWERGKYVITVVVLEAGLRDTAIGADFRRVEDLRATSLPNFRPELGPDDWVHTFYQGDIKADWIRTQCCRGLRAYSGSRSGPDHPSTGGKEVVLNNFHGRSAVITTNENAYEGVLDAIVESFRFLDVAPAKTGATQPLQSAP